MGVFLYSCGISILPPCTLATGFVLLAPLYQQLAHFEVALTNTHYKHAPAIDPPHSSTSILVSCLINHNAQLIAPPLLSLKEDTFSYFVEWFHYCGLCIWAQFPFQCILAPFVVLVFNVPLTVGRSIWLNKTILFVCKPLREWHNCTWICWCIFCTCSKLIQHSPFG